MMEPNHEDSSSESDNEVEKKKRNQLRRPWM